MIVIDASALAKYVLHEENWEAVSMYVKGMKPLYSIDHIVKEAGLKPLLGSVREVYCWLGVLRGDGSRAPSPVGYSPVDGRVVPLPLTATHDPVTLRKGLWARREVPKGDPKQP